MLSHILGDIFSRHKDKIAVKTPLVAYTYEHLDRHSDYLVHELLKYPSGEGRTRVALLFEHGADMITATVAAIKAKRGYVPLTPTYPNKRLCYMIENAGCGVLITNDESYHLAEKLCAALEQPPLIINLAQLEQNEPGKPMIPRADGDREAYVLYTSGSTGNPKGVIQREESIIHYCRAYAQTFGIQPEDRLTLFSTFGHDAAVIDIFTSLIHGATLYPLSIMTESHLSHLADWLNANEITIWHSVPAFFRFFMNSLEGDERFPNLRHIVLGGEAVHLNDFNKAAALFPTTSLANLYGQSESSYNSTFIAAPGQKVEKITLGEAIQDITMLVVNEEGEEVDPFQVGEIVIGSPYIASGYLGQDADNSCFSEDEDFGRLYWTGDLGRVLLDGDIEFMGRSDFRVKIRGNRIELGEIENAVLAYTGIREVLVDVFTDPSTENRYLAAFLEADEPFSANRLREYLRRELPDYMVPSYLVKLDRLPRTATGKLDRRNLPDPMEYIQREMDYREPTNDIEKRLVELWRQVLKVQRIGIDDDFFELGGHSLRAMNMLSRIHQIFEVDIQLSALFRRPTIREIGLLIANAERRGKGHIERVETRDHYPLSAAQRRLYILHGMDPKSTNYNMFFPIRINGQLDADKLAQAFQQLVDAHESLRTSFHLIDEQPVQKIHDQVSFHLIRREVAADHIGQAIAALNSAFDLAEPCQMRVALLSENPRRHVLVINIHHIITDGTSNLILFRDLLAYYSGDRPEAANLHYKDFAVWQQNQDQAAGEQFWLQQFEEPGPALTLPTDRPRPALQSFEGAELQFEIGNALTEELKAVSRRQGATLFMTLISTWYVLLHKYSGQEDITVGSPIAGRPHNDLRELVGMFVNTMALRARPHSQLGFHQFLEQVKTGALAAYQHQDYPFEALVEKVVKRRDFSRNPLFDTMFVLQNMEQPHFQIDNLDFSVYQMRETTAKFDLTLIGHERDGGILFNLTYARKLFDPATMERLKGHFLNLLEQICRDPRVSLAQLRLSDNQEHQALLQQAAGPRSNFPSALLHQLFEQQAQQHPHKTALIHGGHRLSYKQLNQAANQIAHALIAQNVEPGQVVTLLAERSPRMAAGILGILKAGAAYHPVDPDYPEQRKSFMIEDIGSALLLTDSPQTGPRLQLRLDGDFSAYPDHNPDLALNAEQPAYVIYTSGTTGRPKGVLVPHRGPVNTLLAREQEYAEGNTQIALQMFSFAFDGFVTSFFSPICAGGTTVLADAGDLQDSGKLSQLLAEHQVNEMIAVPQLYKLILETADDQALARLKRVVLAGDQVAPELIRAHRRRCPNAELAVEYGVTEASVMSTIRRDQQNDERVTIGRPVANTDVYVLGPERELQPIGIPGELYIGGTGVALGYHGRPELTQERFIANPFGQGTLYRSGDRARLLEDGSLEFLGRLDYQVKIRGFRIEPAEIANQLMMRGDIREAVVVDYRDERNEAYLAAYFTAEKTLAPDSLKNDLARDLPDYMIPAYLMQLEQFPLTPNGKIDKAALPKPQTVIGVFQAPENDTERELVRLWAETLKRDAAQISRDANFFDLGGHSLSAVNLLAKIQRRFNVRIPLSILFKLGTVQALAAHIERSESVLYAAIKPAPAAESYPLSAAQRRLFVLHQAAPESTAYNIPVAVRIEGNLAGVRFEHCLNQLVSRHEALRTGFFMEKDTPVQRVLPQAHIQLETFQMDEDQLVAAASDFVRPFQLDQAPLLRARLIQYGPERYLFLLDMHHIIADGLSGQILLREFATLYHGDHVPLPRLQYKDFAVWQQGAAASQMLQEQADYHRLQFEDGAPLLELPTDFQRPVLQSFAGAGRQVRLSREQSRRLADFARERELTPFMLLFGAYALLLSKYADSNDLVIGTPVAGRPHGDLQNIIGMFVNTLAVRVRPQAELSLDAYFEHVRKTLTGALDHADYPFEQLVEDLDLPRDTSRNPIFDTMFSFLGEGEQTLAFNDFTIKPFAGERNIAKFDLLVDTYEDTDGYQFNFQYATALFQPGTIRRMTQHWLNLLEHILANPGQTVARVQLEAPIPPTATRANPVDIDPNLSLIDLFNARVAAQPERIALIFGEQHISYGHLAELVEQRAAQLIQAGIRPGNIVALACRRGPGMIIAQLATLKAGAAYLPLDPNYPSDRTQFLLKDSGAAAIIIDQVEIEAGSLPRINLQETAETTEGAAFPAIDPEQTAYIIYTSGSTGRPKGVRVPHRGAVNLAIGQTLHFQVDPDDRILQFSNYCFDASVEQIWIALHGGAALVLIDETALADPQRFADVLNQQRVTHLHAVPAFLETLDPDHFPNLTRVVAGGDVCRPQLAERWYKRCAFYNEYGPTETTVTSIQKRVDHVDPRRPIAIGTPVANTFAYILDRDQNPVPTGIPGELYLGGRGVTLGYLNRPEEQETRFLADPFNDGLMYRTGDRVRQLENGDLLFLGRIDHQIKLRGYRIELGEIETRLAGLQGIREAAILVKPQLGEAQFLAAYIVGDLNAAQAKAQLAALLPEYMVPTQWAELEALPKTSGGKVDRGALHKIELSHDQKGGQLNSPLQQQIAQLWAETLVIPIERIGAESNFFHLGGHSLKAGTLAQKLRAQLDIELSLLKLFQHPTLSALATYIEQAQAEKAEPIPFADRDLPVPLSDAQERMFVMWQMQPRSTFYNMPAALEIQGKLDIQRLESAVTELIARHEILRTRFLVEDQSARQIIDQPWTFQLETIRCEVQDIEQTLRDLIKPFDLGRGPLLRGYLIQAGDRRILLFDQHHIISDGGSMNLFVRELVALYGGRETARPRLQYRDFAHYQQSERYQTRIQEQSRFWLEQFQTPAADVQTPLDRTRPAQGKYEGDRYNFQLQGGQKLEERAQQLGLTPFMIGLGAYQILLTKLSGQEDVTVGVPSAGRNHPDLENMLGIFVNTLPMRAQVNAGQTVADFLNKLKNFSLQALANADYPLDQLVAAQNRQAPPFRHIYVQQENPDRPLHVAGLGLKPQSLNSKTSKCDLTLYLNRQGETLHAVIEYDTQIYNRDTIVRFADYYRDILGAVLEDPNRQIQAITIQHVFAEATNFEEEDGDFDF